MKQSRHRHRFLLGVRPLVLTFGGASRRPDSGRCWTPADERGHLRIACYCAGVRLLDAPQV
jgi:hypothetical protein